MIKIIPFDIAHIDLLEFTDEDKANYGEVTRDATLPMAEHGMCFTAVEDGRVLVVGGILQTTIHTGHCWTFVSRYAHGQGLGCLRVVKRQLENMMQDMRIHRVETANLKSAEGHHKWCRLLGFHEEGEMKYYDDKKRTFKRFAKYSEE